LHLSDAQFAVLLHRTRLERVENDGAIRFEIGNQPFEFYHVDSITCAEKRGQKVLVSYSTDFPDMIFVLSADHRFLEPIPSKRALPWFNYEQLGQEIREQEIAIKRASRELAEIHGADIRQQTYAGRGNVEKVENWRDGRITHILPAETSSADPDSRSAGGAARVSPANSEPTTGVELARSLSPSNDADSPASSAPRLPARPSLGSDLVADEALLEPRYLTVAAPNFSPRPPHLGGASRGVADQIHAATSNARARVGTVADQQRAADRALAQVESTARQSRRERIRAKYGATAPVS
jgi:hypothetical protein